MTTNSITLNDIKAMYGKADADDVETLASLASQVQSGGIIVQIGAGYGKTSAAIAYGMNQGALLIDIDLFSLGKGRGPTWWGMPETLETYKQNTDHWRNRIITLEAEHQTVSRALIRCPISMLFVDCSKEETSATKLWKAWLPHCIDIVSSHDANIDKTSKNYFPGVLKAIENAVIPVTHSHNSVGNIWSGRMISNG